MPNPNVNSVHIDAILTNISVAYLQDDKNFVADKIFPVVPVEKKTDKYFIYDKNDWFRDEAQRRAPATESAGGGYNLSTDVYNCDVFAFHKDVDDQTLANSDNPLQPLRDATTYVASRMRLRRELQFVTDYFKTGVWATDITGVATAPSAGQLRQWSDYTASDPITDFEDAKAKVLSTTGLEVNTCLLGYDVFRQLKNHPDLVDRVKYTSSKVITEDILASLFDIERVIVAKAVKATNKEGGAGAYSFAFGKNVLFTHVAPSPGLLVPSAGYTFAWTGVSGGLGATIGTSQFRMQNLKADRIESEIAFDNKVVATDLGYFVSGAVA